MDLQSNCKFTIANAKEITLPTKAIFFEPKGVNVLGIPHFICSLVHHIIPYDVSHSCEQGP